jgi:hypothetical protein
MSEIIEYEEDTSTDLVQRPYAGLFAIDHPAEVLEKASEIARLLKQQIARGGQIVKIKGRDYILFEGWRTLAALVGVNVMVEWSRPVDVVGWEAAAVVIDSSGARIGRAEAQCLRNEAAWRNREDFALRSMAQTRAQAKALRSVLGFIVVLAGYEATPADEMPAGDADVPFDRPDEGFVAEAKEEFDAVEVDPPMETIAGPSPFRAPTMKPSAAQNKKMYALFRERGITEPGRRRGYCGDVVGRRITSASDLSGPEVGLIIDALERESVDA